MPWRGSGSGWRAISAKPAAARWSSSESREKTRAYLNEFGPPLRQSFALDRDWTTTRPYLEGLGVLGIPYAVIVAPDGTIAWHGDPMSDELVEALRSLI